MAEFAVDAGVPALPLVEANTLPPPRGGFDAAARALAAELDLELAVDGAAGGGGVHGHDSAGTDYASIVELWTSELERRAATAAAADAGAAASAASSSAAGDSGAGAADGGAGADDAPWYSDAAAYWDDEGNCAIDNDGVLGGYGHITPTDYAGSRAFLDALAQNFPSMRFERAADVGAGIGRVAKGVLLPRYERVDLLEQSARLLAAAPAYVGADAARRMTLLRGSMQQWAPAAASYDLVWIQWVIGHLTDADTVGFLARCKAALRPGGFLVVKDNFFYEDDEDGDEYYVDRDDSSIIRSPRYMRALFKRAGLETVAEIVQDKFPSELYPVRMVAFSA